MKRQLSYIIAKTPHGSGDILEAHTELMPIRLAAGRHLQKAAHTPPVRGRQKRRTTTCEETPSPSPLVDECVPGREAGAGGGDTGGAGASGVEPGIGGASGASKDAAKALVLAETARVTLFSDSPLIDGMGCIRQTKAREIPSHVGGSGRSGEARGWRGPEGLKLEVRPRLDFSRLQTNSENSPQDSPSLPSKQFQLRTHHVPLAKHLFRINKHHTSVCPCCGFIDETVDHYLHEDARRQLHTSSRLARYSKLLLADPELLPALFAATLRANYGDADDVSTLLAVLLTPANVLICPSCSMAPHARPGSD
ncbi:hypothetical protein DFH07DRAFT_973720 [Mycena maculata]|uniref:Uncharacterized protein n=1 Tax=Mycena maculata TaxID=230809 RepID=A0AAD7MI33_9AGAR|nr:hypothetical protein DFH07DRAFT_973720 [Mycena maculata]